MLILKIAVRNLLRQRRRTILTALTMTTGFILGAFFIGFSDGSYNHIIRTFTSTKTGQIQVHRKGYLDKPSLYKNIENYNSVLKKIKAVKGVKNCAPRIFSFGLVSVKDKSSAASVTGISIKEENELSNFSKKIISGHSFTNKSSKEAVIGKGLAKLLKAECGSSAVVVSQAADGSIANDRYIIRGIADFGDSAENRTAFYLNIRDMQELFALKNRVHEIAVNTENMDETETIREAIRGSLHNNQLSVKTWKEFAKSFYLAMKADQDGMWISLIIVVLLVATGVLNTVLMSVLERRREYGVLKALGTTPAQIIKMVFTEITFLALFSSAAGFVFSFILNSVMSEYGISIPPVDYGGMVFEKMTSEINLRSFLIPFITVFCSALTVTLFPALKAAKTDPARSMRQF